MCLVFVSLNEQGVRSGILAQASARRPEVESGIHLVCLVFSGGSIPSDKGVGGGGRSSRPWDKGGGRGRPLIYPIPARKAPPHPGRWWISSDYFRIAQVLLQVESDFADFAIRYNRNYFLSKTGHMDGKWDPTSSWCETTLTHLVYLLVSVRTKKNRKVIPKSERRTTSSMKTGNFSQFNLSLSEYWDIKSFEVVINCTNITFFFFMNRVTEIA